MLKAIIIQAVNLAPTSLCCHMHDDGSQGCWPAESSTADFESTLNCPNGAHQANPDDEESWACNPKPRPNS